MNTITPKSFLEILNSNLLKSSHTENIINKEGYSLFKDSEDFILQFKNYKVIIEHRFFRPFEVKENWDIKIIDFEANLFEVNHINEEVMLKVKEICKNLKS